MSFSESGSLHSVWIKHTLNTESTRAGIWKTSGTTVARLASSKVTWDRVGVHARAVSLLLLTTTLLDVMPKHSSSCHEGNLSRERNSRVDLMQIQNKKLDSRFSAAP